MNEQHMLGLGFDAPALGPAMADSVGCVVELLSEHTAENRFGSVDDMLGFVQFGRHRLVFRARNDDGLVSCRRRWRRLRHPLASGRLNDGAQRVRWRLDARSDEHAESVQEANARVA